MHMFNFIRRGRPKSAAPETEALSPAFEKVDEDGVPRVENSDVQRAQRVPPGQSKAKKWPVLHYGDVPTVDLATWDLRVFGAVDRPLRLKWDEVAKLPRVRVHADMHCVTTWSVIDQVWEGYSIPALLEMAGVHASARFLMAHGADLVGPKIGYCTNMPLHYVLPKEGPSDALLATHCNGQLLTPDHGGPMRLVVPRLYAWKSAKWVRALELLDEDRKGFWERNGYHDRADPWTEERFG